MDGVTPISFSRQTLPAPNPDFLTKTVAKTVADEEHAANIPFDFDNIELEIVKNELKDYILNANYRMEVRMHDKLHQVVVKVIDRETDKVVKELPAALVQEAHVRIREVLGLLIDEQF